MPAPDDISVFAERLKAVGAEYMITGATAAILYGQPRVTNDVDIVVALGEQHFRALLRMFPEEEFYVPPESVIRAEAARSLRGHFNLIRLETGFKADIYLVGTDPLHAWALPLRRRIEWEDVVLQVAPPEYVILRKLEYFREGGSTKHSFDIQAILRTTEIDNAALATWVGRLGLEDTWAKVRGPAGANR